MKKDVMAVPDSGKKNKLIAFGSAGLIFGLIWQVLKWPWLGAGPIAILIGVVTYFTLAIRSSPLTKKSVSKRKKKGPPVPRPQAKTLTTS